MNEPKLNVFQRLLEVRKSVDYLQKDAKNQGQGFSYVSSSQTLAAVREAMNKQGLMLMPTVHDFEVRDHPTAKGGNWYFTILRMEFVWINVDNPEDRFHCKWTGQGLDQGEKGVGKALTYGEKYFILKTFNIPTDKDDPDAFEQKHDKNGKSKTTTKKQTNTEPKKQTNAEFAETLDKPIKTRDDKIKLIRGWLGEIARWGFEEDKSGAMLRFKIEKQETINENATAALKEFTAFEGKNGKKGFPGFDSMKPLEKLKENWFNSAYGSVKTAHEAWKEKFDNSQE